MYVCVCLYMFDWRARHYQGVYRFNICDMYIHVYMDVCKA